MPTVQERLRAARVIHMVFLTTVPIYATLGETIGAVAVGDFSTIRPVFFVMPILVAFVGFLGRARMLPAALDALRRSPDDAASWQRWSTANFFSWVAAESVVLFGLFLRFLAGTLWESLPFYIVGMGLMLAWSPITPVEPRK